MPFLEDTPDVAINESIAMMLYIAQRYGPAPLLPAGDDPALARVLQLDRLAAYRERLLVRPAFQRALKAQ